MGNKQWADAWKAEVKTLSALLWIPSEADSKRVREIQKELNDIIDRNTSGAKAPPV